MPIQDFPNRIGMTRIVIHGDLMTIDRLVTNSLDVPFMSRYPQCVSYLPRDRSLVFLPLRFRLNSLRIYQRLVLPTSPPGGILSQSGQHSPDVTRTIIAMMPYPLNLLFEKVSLIIGQRTTMPLHLQAITKHHTQILSNQIHSSTRLIQIQSI